MVYLHLTPGTKGTFDILCPAQTFSECGTHQALQLGPATFPPGLAQLSRELCAEEMEGGRQGGALKKQSLLSESISHPHHQNGQKGNQVEEVDRRVVRRRLPSCDLFEIGFGAKTYSSLGSWPRALSLTGFLVSFKETGPNSTLICCVTLSEFFSLSEPWFSLYKMKRKNWRLSHMRDFLNQTPGQVLGHQRQAKLPGSGCRIPSGKSTK